MNLSGTVWAEVSDWFNRLIDLDDEERQQQREQADLNPEVQLWLDRMLKAHDSPEPLLVDQAVDALIADLSTSANDIQLPEDWTGKRLGQWQIVREIERGGMASVMLAERIDGSYERQVAIKVLHPDLPAGRNEQSLRHEIQMLARLSHPGIVHLIDGGITETGWPYLVMEYVVGQPLDQWCEQHQPVLEQRIELLRQIASALIHAHRQLIVHADIKPSNVLVESDARVRLVDFGIARLTQTDQTEPKLLALMGSPGWAAPEQLQGQPPTVANDVFGLGMLMHALLTGSRPRQGSDVTRWLAGKSIKDQFIAPSMAEPTVIKPAQLKGELDAICLKALSADPAKRYASVEAMDQDLEHWQHKAPVQAFSNGLSYRIRKWFARHSLPTAAGALAILALIGGTTVSLIQSERAQAEAERATLQAERSEAIKNFLISIFESANPWKADGNELDTREVLRQGARQLASNDTLDSETRFEIHHTLGEIHTGLGWFEDARQQYDNAFAVLTANTEFSALQKSRLWISLGTLENHLGRLNEAEQALDQAKALLEHSEEPEATVLNVRLNLVYNTVFSSTNRVEEAEHALARAKSTLIDFEESKPMLWYHIHSKEGELAFMRADMAQAYQHMLNAKQSIERSGNPQQPEALGNLSNLAFIATQLGRLDEGLRYDQLSVELARQIFPPEHPEIASSLYGLGDTLRLQGQFDEALKLLDEAFVIQTNAGLEVQAALTNNARARTLLSLGRWQEAALKAQNARVVFDGIRGPASRTALDTLTLEVEAYSKAGAIADFEQAVALADDRLDQVEPQQQWGPVTQKLRWQIALMQYLQSNYSASWVWLNQAREAPIREGRRPLFDVEISSLELLLIQQTDRLADSDHLDRLIQSVLTGLQEQPKHPDTQALAQCSLAITHADLGEQEAAVEARAKLRYEPCSRSGSTKASARGVATMPRPART
ncbi:MAG: serine/threonine-protein kinase, partial [Pseudomonadota bacterium]